MKKIIKSLLILSIALNFTSCVSEDDFSIPEFAEYPIFESFESSTSGSGANEVPVSLDGWINTNLGTGNRVWGVKQFSNNKFAEFSSFYSVAPDTDEAWLITSEINLKDKSYIFTFDAQVRFFTNNNLTVLISQDFSGDVNEINDATWVELNPSLPGSGQENSFYPSGEISLDEYKNSTIRIAFRYIGSKQANTTSTFQIDNIKVFEQQ